MDLVTLKAFFQTKVGSKTAAGSIYPVDITDCLDALADAVDAGDIGGGGGGLTQLATPTLTATVISSTQIDLSWTNVANESSYLLQSSPDNVTFSTINSPAADTTSYSNTGLTPSTLYYYRIKAVGDGITYSDSAYGTDSDTTSAGSSYETESDTFFAANTGLSTPQKDAVDALVVSLKAIGWTKFKAVYPFIGGSAAAHKWNLINPVDTNGGFRITWDGTITHDANGITGDGTTGWGETYLDLATDISSPTTSNHLSVYSRTNSNPSNYYESDNASAGEMRWGILVKQSGDAYGFNGSTITAAVTTSQRLFVNTRTAHNVFKLFQDNTQVGSTETTTQTGATPQSVTQPVLAYKANGTVTQYSGRNIAFMSIGDGLSDADVAALNTAVNTYQTALSRNV